MNAPATTAKPRRARFNPFPNVSGRYGAPMGRHGNAADSWDGHGRLHACGAGGYGDYDRGGAYWGRSDRDGWVYAVYTDRGEWCTYVRAYDRADAIAQVRELAPPRDRYGTILRIYDDGGKTCDRYTIIPPRWAAPGYRSSSSGLWDAIGASAKPFHPQGFGQRVTAEPGPHLGKRIAWSDLPSDVQLFARQSFPEYAP